MKTTDAAIGKWGLIFDHFGLPPIDPRKHYPGECCICGKKHKLRIDDKDGMGTWVCVCGAGTGFDLLIQATGREFGELAKEIDRIIGNEFDDDTQKPKSTAEDRAISTFKRLVPIRGTPGQDYLLSRGISVMPSGGAKWNGAVQCKDLGRTVPAIWALASDPLGRPAAIHCTFIEDGGKIIETYDRDGEQIQFPSRKQFSVRESHGPLAIKLFSPGECLGIAEGIETALAASQLFSMPVWAVLNASLMRRFRPPNGVKTMVLYSDNDRHGKGLAAAFHAATCSLHSKNDLAEAVIRWPKKLNDFNDVLLHGDDVLEHRLSR